MNQVFDWDYTPARGKFTVLVGTESGTQSIHHESYPTLDDAVRMFARYGLPMRRRAMALIMDELDVSLLHYYCRTNPMEASWWGCETAFRALDDAGIATAVDRAIWEANAKYAMGVPS
jgi:hypothetical protein